MSILNTKNVDTTKEPIFLGQPLGLQRFDRYKYPVFFDLFNKQLTFFWRPEERELSLDRTQFAELEPHEKRIFTKNLLFQTMLDSVVARGVPSFTQYVTNPELEICLNTWGFFENIHSYSYTYIIKNVYPDASKVLDQCLEDDEILKRADSVTKHYDALNEKIEGLDDLRKKIYLSLVSVNILEGLRFYVSFVCAFAFGENKKMMGNANIIKLIRRDEACLDDISEILTDRGWIRFPELKSTDRVAQYHQDGSVSFVIPDKIINKPYYGEMISYKNKTGHIDMLLTPDHRVIYLNDKKELIEKTALDYKPNALNYIPVAGKAKNTTRVLGKYEKFLIALQADGSIHDLELRDGSRSGCHTVSFTFAKQRKIDRLISILDDLDFEYSLSDYDKRGRRCFRVKVPTTFILTKNFKDWVIDYSRLGYDWCHEFIEEMSNWDGSVRKDTGSYYYSSTVEDNTEVVQTIASLCGYKTYKYSQKDTRKESYKIVHRLSIMKNKNIQSGQSLVKSTVLYDGHVYCVSVPTGMFVARRNNGIFITGNCHMFTTQTIVNILRKNKDEGFSEIIADCQQEAVDMFLSAVEEEKAWATYLFKDGSMLGLNEVILHKYIEWLADTRMVDLGLPKHFNTKNPIGGWLEPWMDSSSVQVAPQETEISSYLISSSVSDVEKTDFSDMSLD